MTLERPEDGASLSDRPSISVDRASASPDDPSTLSDLVRLTIITKATERLVTAEPAIQQGTDADAVHRARVAVRRLRSDLRTFGPVLDRSWVRELRDELAWLGDLAAPVRDAEVLLARFDGVLATMSGGEPGPGKAILDELETTRIDERRRLRGAPVGPLPGARGEARRRGRRASPARRRARRARLDGARLLRRPWKAPDAGRSRRTRRERPLAPPSPDPGEAARYGAEAMVPALGKPARSTAAAAEALQEVLGEHQDAVVAIAWLSAHALATDDPALAFTAGRLAEHESCRERPAPRAEIWRRLERAHRRLG